VTFTFAVSESCTLTPLGEVPTALATLVKLLVTVDLVHV